MAESSDLKFAASSGGARAWQKVLKRSTSDNLRKATEIGWLRPQDSRVNLLGVIDKPDKQNNYSFKVLERGKFVVTAQADADIRIRILDDHQRVIADSKPNMGAASENYAKMAKDELTLEKGKYYAVVSRGAGVASDQRVNFAMQMLVGDGTYKNDYLTREVSPNQQERLAAIGAPDNPNASPTVGFLGDFASASSGNILSSGSRTGLVGKVLSVLA